MGIILVINMIDYPLAWHYGHHANASVWSQLMWALLANIGWELTPVKDVNPATFSYNSVTKSAWDTMLYGCEGIFGTLLILNWFAYIKDPLMHKVYFFAIVFGMMFSWLLALSVNILFLAGGLMDGADWSNLYVPLIFDLFLFGFEAIVVYAVGPGMVDYYRWNEQDWWNPKWGHPVEDETMEMEM